jgi:hypothetical protein
MDGDNENSMPAVGVTLSPSQSLQLMALGVMFKDLEIFFASETDDEIAKTAKDLLVDIAQECALQLDLSGKHEKVAAAAENVTSFASARFYKRQDPAIHNPRSALEVATEWFDQNPEPPNHCIVIFGRDTADGGSGTRFFQAGTYRHHGQMGVMLEGMNMIRESGKFS